MFSSVHTAFTNAASHTHAHHFCGLVLSGLQPGTGPQTKGWGPPSQSILLTKPPIQHYLVSLPRKNDRAIEQLKIGGVSLQNGIMNLSDSDWLQP